jgi:catechol 2,3-dioxygenase-like lactoylglutathione lyase family enzyme
MQNTLGRIVLLVKDYDEARSFYENALGFSVIFETTTPDGQRFLHMAPQPDATTGIWFFQAHTPEALQLIGNQTGGHPTFVLYTDAFDTFHQQLISNQVHIKTTPQTTPAYKFLHFLDLYGNEIILVQLNK